MPLSQNMQTNSVTMENRVESLSESNAAVDVTQSNFENVLPDVLKHIAECDFIAFDLEFSGSGYKSYFRSVSLDTVSLEGAFHM